MPLSRRPRRRAGAKPASLASRRHQHNSQLRNMKSTYAKGASSDMESPEDNRNFDEDFWREQRPPHWG